MAILGYKNSNRAHSIRAFGLAEWLDTRGLAGWLEIATDGLEEPARQRIADEIGVHYAEAVSAHLAAGEPELSAHSAALANLGDPTEAAQNFQKSHLTELEAKSLKWIERTAAKPLFSFRALPLDSIPLAAVALFLWPLHWNFRPLIDNHFFASCMLAAYTGFRLIPRILCTRTLTHNSFLRALSLSYLITSLVLVFSFALVIYVQEPGPAGALNAVFISLIYGYRLNPGFQIWIKLRKMDDERKDLHLRPSTSS